jgi:hypothetical protein
MSILTGTAAGWATFAAIIGAAFTALGIWFKHGPDRRRAQNELAQIETYEAELIRTDYAKQIKDFRMEVHGETTFTPSRASFVLATRSVTSVTIGSAQWQSFLSF